MIYTITGRPMPSAEERNRLFYKYVWPWRDYVRNLVAQRSRHPSEVDDNVQDVLASLLDGIACYDPAQGEVRPWLARVVCNRMANITDRQQRRAPYWADHPSLYLPDTLADDADGALTLSDDAVPQGMATPPAPRTLLPEAEDYSPATYRALQSLSVLHRRALLLTAEGWTPSDLAAELRMTPAAARTMLCRARAAMVSALQATGDADRR